MANAHSLRRVYVYATTDAAFPRDLSAEIAAALDAGNDCLGMTHAA